MVDWENELYDDSFEPNQLQDHGIDMLLQSPYDDQFPNNDHQSQNDDQSQNSFSNFSDTSPAPSGNVVSNENLGFISSSINPLQPITHPPNPNDNKVNLEQLSLEVNNIKKTLNYIQNQFLNLPQNNLGYSSNQNFDENLKKMPTRLSTLARRQTSGLQFQKNFYEMFPKNDNLRKKNIPKKLVEEVHNFIREGIHLRELTREEKRSIGLYFDHFSEKEKLILSSIQQNYNQIINEIVGPWLRT